MFEIIKIDFFTRLEVEELVFINYHKAEISIFANIMRDNEYTMFFTGKGQASFLQ